MPGDPGVREPDVAAVLDGIGQEEHLGIPLQAVLGVDVDLQLAEAAREADLLRLGQLLPAEKDHAMLVECVVDLPEGRVVDLPGEVHAANLRSQGFARRHYLDRLRMHGFTHHSSPITQSLVTPSLVTHQIAPIAARSTAMSAAL